MKLLIAILPISIGTIFFCKAQDTQSPTKSKHAYNTYTSRSQNLDSASTSKAILLEDHNKELQKLIQKQTKQVQELSNSLNKNKPDILELWMYSIVLSVIAAIIFWFAFSYFPEGKRRRALRPKIKAKLNALKLQLFFSIDATMYIGKHYGSLSQHKITSGTLTKSEIQLALHSKCLNEKYFYDSVVSHLLIPIGEKLYEGAKKIDKQIEHLFSFSALLSSREILLLESVRQTSQVYDFSDPKNNIPGVELGGQILLPVYPSMTYRFENFYKCLTLYVELQEIIHNTAYGKNNLRYEIANKLFHKGKYKQCQKVLYQEYKEKAHNQPIWILSEFISGNKAKSYEYLKTELLRQDRLEMVSNRFFV